MNRYPTHGSGSGSCSTTPIYNTNETKYPKGTMNPTERKVITRNLCIDTMFRKNYDKTSPTNFVYTLPTSINNVMSMSVSAIEFPNAWYTFTDENQSNEFTITLYNTPTPSDLTLVDPTFEYPQVITHVIQVPPGNYQSNVLPDVMNNLFINTRNGLEFLWFSIDEIDTKVSFRTKTSGDGTNNPLFVNDAIYEASNGDFYFTLDFRVSSQPGRPLYRNAGWLLGFRQPYYESRYLETPVVNRILADSVFYYNWYLKSESSYGSGIHNYVYLDIDDFNKNFTTNTIVANTENDAYLGNNTMGRISVTTGMNTIITNTASDRVFKKREYFGPVKLEKLHIRLLNKFGEPILLNGNDFSFALEIEQLYS